MPSESAELRMLRAKAYGPGDGLSADELARLEVLEGWVGAPGPSGADAGATQPAEPEPEPEPHGDASDFFAASPESDSSTGAGGDPGGHGSGRSIRRWAVLVAAAVAVLAIGFGVGWGIWGWDSRAAALVVAHGGTQAEIESRQLYDPGTVVPVAEDHGVVVWRADRSDSEEICVIVTANGQNQHGCVAYEQLEGSVWPSAHIQVPQGHEGAGQQLVAGLIPTPTGELVPFIQIWDQSAADWESRYSQGELAQLRQFEAAGYEPSTFDILGYDGDHVIWSRWDTGGLCVVALSGQGPTESCADDVATTLTIRVTVDGVLTDYVVRQTEMRGPQLTIIRNPEGGATGPDAEGSIDEPMFDDLVIDDTTGEIGG